MLFKVESDITNHQYYRPSVWRNHTYRHWRVRQMLPCQRLYSWHSLSTDRPATLSYRQSDNINILIQSPDCDWLSGFKFYICFEVIYYYICQTLYSWAGLVMYTHIHLRPYFTLAESTPGTIQHLWVPVSRSLQQVVASATAPLTYGWYVFYIYTHINYL